MGNLNLTFDSFVVGGVKDIEFVVGKHNRIQLPDRLDLFSSKIKDTLILSIQM